MNIEQSKLSKIQSIASILSAVAIPIVIALVGWWVQSSMANESIKKDYVQMAISILKDADVQKDEEMRKWAVDVLNKNAPVPFSSDLMEKLEQGSIFIRPTFPSPPDGLMKPPVELQPLPGSGPVETQDMLINVVENYGRCHENAITLKYLQQWVTEIKAIYDKPMDQADPDRNASAPDHAGP